MMRSMYSGVSGLRVHQTKMDVIGNNISNVNTTGFKSSRVTFSDVFSQTVSGASAPSDETGRAGTNPMQIGLGVGVGSIDRLMGIGAAQRTDRDRDLMLQDDSFFIVSDGTGTYFTRNGAFDIDVEGNVHLNGLHVMGWDTVRDPVTQEWEIQVGTVQPLKIDGEKLNATPSATNLIELTGNLNAADVTDPIKRNVEFYDSLGNRYTMEVAFQYIGVDASGNAQWEMFIPVSETTQDTATPPNDIRHVYMYLNGDKTKPVEIYSDDTTNPINLISNMYIGDQSRYHETAVPGPPPVPGTPSTNIITYSTGGDFVSGVNLWFNIAAGPNMDPPRTFGNGGVINFDAKDTTQYGEKTTNIGVLKYNGNYAGTLTGLSFGTDGTIYGRYSNNTQRALGQIAVANFANAAGLESIGNSLFATTINSGFFDGQGQTGVMQAGVLEMSNVDLSYEFTEMITTQRGYQANSRIITVSDDMLQELVNLKR